MRTLILNAGYEPMLLVGWQRALCLVLAQKAEIVSAHQTIVVRSVNANYPLPTVVRLNRYIPVIQRFRTVKCSRKNILVRDTFECQYCGVKLSSQSGTIDHIIPISRGGKTAWNNVVAACAPCNHKKGDRLLTEINMKLRSRPRKPSWSDWLKRLHEDVDDDWLPYLSHVD